jgi:hypothetical protein
MIPACYGLKKLVADHRDKLWRGHDLDDLIAAPIFLFPDQNKFDSEEVRSTAKLLATEPLQLPHDAVLFEVRHNGLQVTEKVVFVKRTGPEIQAYFLAAARVGRRWTDVLVHACLKSDGIVDVEPNPGLPTQGDAIAHGDLLISMVLRALAILAQQPKISNEQVPRTRRPKLARAGVTGWTWHIVAIDTERMRTAARHLGGTHASPRWHIRRGHWRTLADGRRTFVRSCEVGDPTRGGVIKDYLVTMGEAA